MEHVIHTIPPVFDRHSRILILGSFPSVQSRQGQFFYHHPRNRFWAVLARVLGEAQPETVEEKRAFLLRNRLAVWDVIASCEIQGSNDSSIRNVVPNDLNRILKAAPIEQILVNGRTAEKLYQKYCQKQTGRPALAMPSTSPANAAWSLERLTEAWERGIRNDRIL